MLYRNDGGNQGDWLAIKTVGTISNADGVGAFITVTPDLAFPNKKLVREISESSSFLSQSEPIAHFGLGPNADLIDLITIEWPASGVVQELRKDENLQSILFNDSNIQGVRYWDGHHNHLHIRFKA